MRQVVKVSHPEALGQQLRQRGSARQTAETVTQSRVEILPLLAGRPIGIGAARPLAHLPVVLLCPSSDAILGQSGQVPNVADAAALGQELWQR
jgi:hypothetical protein